MADLMGVNRGVLTTGRYGQEDKSDSPADSTRPYQSIGVSSVRTHGDCFDVANNYGLFPRSEVASAGELPIEHSIDLEKYEYDAGGAVPSLVDDDVALVQLRREIQQAWHDIFDNPNHSRELVWSTEHLSGLLKQLEDNVDVEALSYKVVDFAFENSGRSFLYWYPKTGTLANDSNYRIVETGASAAYRALVDAGIDVYFRVGESMGGPTYVAERLLDNQAGSNISNKEDYADVARTLLPTLVDSSVSTQSIPLGADDSPDFSFELPSPPKHLEIWNEPDDEFYAYFHEDVAAFGADFMELYKAISRRFRTPFAPPWSLSPRVGGSGFTRNGMQAFVDWPNADSKVREILLHTSSEHFDFVSFHWYSRSTDEGPEGTSMGERFSNRALTFASDLSDFTSSLRAFFEGEWGLLPGSDLPEIHVTEWNIQLPAAAERPESEKNWCVGIECAAFVGAAMAWMQCPGIDIEKAHFFAGRDRAGGLFHFQLSWGDPGEPWDPREPVRVSPWSSSASGQDDLDLEIKSGGFIDWDVAMGLGAEESVPVPSPSIDAPPLRSYTGTRSGTLREYQFKVRASAVAMSLFCDVAGQDRAPLTIVREEDLIEGTIQRTWDAINAAKMGYSVTAVAFEGDVAAGDRAYSFVLSNLSASTKEVNLEISGLPAGTYRLTSRSVDTSIPHGGITIPQSDLERTHDGRFRPKEGVSEAAIASGIVEQSYIVPIESTGTETTSELGVELPAYAVVRWTLSAWS